MARTNRKLPTLGPQQERGVVLMVALIVLVALTLAGLSMVRSADTGVVIAGNLSFRQAATHAMDSGVEAAINEVDRILGTGWVASGTAVTDRYYPFLLPDNDRDGLPDLPGGRPWRGPGNPQGAYVITFPSPMYPRSMNDYTVRYVIERMCATGQAIATDRDADNQCNLEPGIEGFTSAKLGSPDLGQARKVHYRVTVKVEDSRNTEAFAQAVLAR